MMRTNKESNDDVITLEVRNIYNRHGNHRSLTIRKQDHERLKQLAVETNIPMAELLSIALDNFLKRVKILRDEADRVKAMPSNKKV